MTQWGLDTLFNPAKRHMDEEKQRLQSTREEIGDSSGGKRIDLESGKVTINRAEENAAADGATAPVEVDSAAVADEAGAEAATASDQAAATESPARARARERRARQARGA
jgi:hypothetical protein